MGDPNTPSFSRLLHVSHSLPARTAGKAIIRLHPWSRLLACSFGFLSYVPVVFLKSRAFSWNRPRPSPWTSSWNTRRPTPETASSRFHRYVRAVDREACPPRCGRGRHSTSGPGVVRRTGLLTHKLNRLAIPSDLLLVIWRPPMGSSLRFKAYTCYRNLE